MSFAPAICYFDNRLETCIIFWLGIDKNKTRIRDAGSVRSVFLELFGFADLLSSFLGVFSLFFSLLCFFYFDFFKIV